MSASIEELEKLLALHPDNEELRVELIDAYTRDPTDEQAYRRRNDLIVSMISYRPVAHTHARFVIDAVRFPADFLRASLEWTRAVAEHPEDLSVLSNAAGFHLFGATLTAIELLGRAQDIDQLSPHWPQLLALSCHIQWFRSTSDSSGHYWARRGLVHYEKAIQLSTTPDIRVRSEIGAMRMAMRCDDIDRADYMSSRLNGVEASLVRNGQHFVYAVLGQLRTSLHDYDKAVENLALAASSMQGFPAGLVFGPDFELCGALRKYGIIDAVVSYLEECKKFWPATRLLSLWQEKVYEMPITFRGMSGHEVL